MISSNASENRYGITYRRQGRDLYSFRVENYDRFRVGVWLNDVWTNLVDFVTIPDFEPGDSIRLAAITNQSTHSFFINDRFPGQVEEGRLTLGNVGLTTFFISDITLAFDNFEYRSPE